MLGAMGAWVPKTHCPDSSVFFVGCVGTHSHSDTPCPTQREQPVPPEALPQSPPHLHCPSTDPRPHPPLLQEHLLLPGALPQ